MSDNNNKQSECIKRLLVCGGIYAVASCLPGIVPAGAIATLGVLSADGLSAISGAIASVIAGNTANAIDNLFGSGEPEPNLLANEDLTKAVGRAIAAIITLVAEDKTKQYDRRTRRHLLDIAKEAKDNWVEIARRKISEADYQELREHRLDEMLTAEGESLAKETALTPEIWLDLFAVLNMAAKAGGGFHLERSVWETVAQQLHTNFPKALRQALKEDFNKDGKAFAGLMLSLLTGIKKEVATLKLTEAELVAVNGRLGEIIDRLNAGEEGQRAFFTEIADNIDSGFAEVCRRCDVLETNITELLGSLDEKIEKMADQIDDLHQTLHRPPLTRQQWRELCRQMLEQLQLRTNVFTNNRGVSPIINDVYVPLALVERREKPQVKPNSPEAESPERKETEEQLVPVSEDEFLRSVLRLGQSKSQGKRIAVVGEPGSGKTTRLQFIADWILREDLGLPVWVSLADLGDKNISSFLESAWLPMLPDEVSLKELKGRANEVWLLLDGLDEMTARIEWRHVESLLGGWVGEARVIVSCRTNVWEAERNAFSGFDVFRNLEFAPAQVEAYIRNWFGKAVEQPLLGEKLLEELAQTGNQRLRDLIGNPLRLWMLCQIWEPGVRLPETQAQLYRRFANWVYKWEKNREFRKRRKEIDGALAKLASSAMENLDRNSRLRLRESWVTEIISEDTFEAVKRMEWLKVVSYDRDDDEAVYSFNHLTFLEYFAALAVPGWGFFLNHVPGKPEGGVYRIFAREWKQVILLWLGRDDVDVGEKEEFVRELVGFEDGCGEWNLLDVDRGFYEYRAYFLAAAGINEFRGCSLAEEIVEQIARWGFGYFDEEKQKWRTYFYLIQKGAREILKETIRDRAIAALEELLATTTGKFTHSQAAESLGQIAPGNELAIAALEKLLATTTNEDTRRRAADCLGQIAPGNKLAITALVELLATTTIYLTRREAAESLGQIAPGNELAITALEELLATTTDEFIREQAAESLWKIAPGNELAITTLVELLATSTGELAGALAAESLRQIALGNELTITALEELLATSTDEFIREQAAETLGHIAPGNELAITALVELLATSTGKLVRRRAAESLGQIAPGNKLAITALVELLATTTDDDICREAAESLGQIAPGNELAITALVELLATTTDKFTRREAAKCLGQIAPGNELAIAALEELLATTTDKFTRREAAECLGQIAPGNELAITALVELLATTTDEYTRREAAGSLGRIAPGNELAITALVELLATTTDKFTRREAAGSLGQIAQGNELSITALVELLATSTDKYTRWQAAWSLGQIAPGNELAITALEELLATTTDKFTREKAAESLRKILKTNEQYHQVVSKLKHCLSNETYQTNYYLFKESYSLIWRCAQNLPYPEFYRAWHGHNPDHANQTPQTFDPQQLNRALHQRQLGDTVQPYYIDGSQFVNPDNPAPEIYDQMLDQNSPQRTQGEPANMQEFKSYWKQLCRQGKPILIFYEDPQPPAPQGFSETFLLALSRCGGSICLVWEGETPSGLPTFSPADPDLIEKLVEWMEECGEI